MHCSPPDSFVHGILQARILENTFHSPGDLSDPGIKLRRQILYHMSHQVHHVYTYQFSSVQSLSRVWLFPTPWTGAHQAPVSSTITRSLLKLMPIESVMPSNRLILCHPLLLLPSIFSASGSFRMSQFSASSGQSIGVSASASVLPMSIQDWFPLGWTGFISLQSIGLSRVFSNTMLQKHQFFGTQLSL